jgi:O-antigen/teichoic acid export membrane protein
VSNYLDLKKIPKRYQIAAVGWLSRLFTGFSQIISIAILLDYLGTDLYAVFAIMIGLQGWLALADCGIGSSLQNYISEARANNKDINVLLSNAVIVIWVLLVVVCLIFICISPLLQYLLLHKIVPALARSQYYILMSAGVVIIATTVFGISYRVLFANHKGHWAYFYQGVGPLVSVFAIVMIRHMNILQYRLLAVLMSWLLPQLIVSFFSYAHSFPFKNVFKHIDYRLIKLLLIRGAKFWGFSASAAFVLLMDYIIMSQTLTAKDITIYNILFKGFNMILFVYSAVLTAIWPEISEMFIKKQWVQANRILITNMLLGIFFVAACALLFLFARNFVMLILAPKTNLILPVTTIILFGFYAIIRVWTDSYAVALQSQSYLKVFWLCVPLQAVLSILGMYFLSLYYGLNGILLGLILCFLLTVSWILPTIYFKRKVIYIV